MPRTERALSYSTLVADKMTITTDNLAKSRDLISDKKLRISLLNCYVCTLDHKSFECSKL